MNALVYLSGPPAAGKSTLMAELTAGYERAPVDRPFAHDLLVDVAAERAVGVELGRRRAAFSGTDALGMGVNPAACGWIAARPHGLVLGEGDRLANRAFLAAAAAAGYDVTLVHVTAPADTLAARRAARGSDQSDAWCRGRATKAANLASAASDAGWRLVGVVADRPAAALAAELRGRVPTLAGVGR